MLKVDGIEINYSGLPAQYRETMRLYLEAGYDPGSGLRAILAHDLAAVVMCDAETAFALPQIYRWMVNYAPSKAHGCYARVADWMRERRAA